MTAKLYKSLMVRVQAFKEIESLAVDLTRMYDKGHSHTDAVLYATQAAYEKLAGHESEE